MTAQRRSDWRRIEDDGEFAVLLREGRGHEQCYDTFAPTLYRYCWTLLGPVVEEGDDAPGAAVRETFLAAVELLPQLRDRGAFRSWLFALARTECQRRGFARNTPYAALPAVAEERAIIAVLRQLPPSHRELLELYLRHGLTPTQIAVMLGLDPETASELCRSAVTRAVDLIAEGQSRPNRAGAGPWALVDIAELLTAITLPGPPRSLRERVVADCTDPAAAPERHAAGAALRPLGADGFPLHRARGSGGAAAATAREQGPVFDTTEEDAERAPAPVDRVTTFDVPARRDPEPLAELAPETGGTASEELDERERRSRWLVPATAGLATALVAFSLWGAGAFLRDTPASTVAEGPPGQVSAAPVASQVEAPLPDQNPGPASPSPSAPVPTPVSDEGVAEETPGVPDAESQEGGQDTRPPEQEPPTAPPTTEAPTPPVADPLPPVQPPDATEPDSVVTTLVDDVLDFLGLGGERQ